MHYLAGLVKLGRTFDIEDARTSYRLQRAKEILSHQGIEADWPLHAEDCMCNPINSFRRCNGYTYYCQPSCPRRQAEIDGPKWPEWVTDRMFELAYDLANEVQTQRASAAHKSAKDQYNESAESPWKMI